MIILAAIPLMAREITATRFAGNPPKLTLRTLMSPRCITYSAADKQIYVLDTGLRRVVSYTVPDGMPQRSWSFPDLGITDDTIIPPDSLLPVISLAPTNGGVCLLWGDRITQKLRVIPLENIERSRDVTLPADAADGAYALNNSGQVVLAAILKDDNAQVLFLQRETNDGGWAMISQRKLPANPVGTKIFLTGFAINALDNYLLGLAQTPEKGVAYSCSFSLSWLARGTGDLLSYKLNNDIAVRLARHPFASQEEKSCVPLLTSLAGTNDLVVSGGQALDPYIRIYGGDGYQLLRSIPFGNGIGGQHLTVIPTDDGMLLGEVSPTVGQVLLYAQDGRRLATIGEPVPYVLDNAETLAANSNGVYTATRWNESWHVLAFTTNGTFRWSIPVIPPDGMEQAKPVLCAISPATILLGWRQPGSAGVGWIVQLDTDGTIAAWFPPTQTPVTEVRISNTGMTSTPIVLGADDRIYVLSETADDTRVLAYSQNALLKQSYPTEVKGISLALADSSILWANMQQGDMVITNYRKDGIELGWRRIHRAATRSTQFLPVRTPQLWGWLTSTDTLIRIDEDGAVVEEVTLQSARGTSLQNVQSLASDGKDRIYLSVNGIIRSALLK